MTFDPKKYGYVATNNKMGYMANFLDHNEEIFINYLKMNGRKGADIGTAFGFLCLEALKLNIQITGVDIEQSHLDHLKKEAQKLNSKLLETKKAAFPHEVDFQEKSLDAVNVSRFLHLLPGKDIEIGLSKIFNWLKSDGILTISCATPFSYDFEHLLPLYEEKKLQGEKWPGEINPQNFKTLDDYYKDTLPSFAHLLEIETLVPAIKDAGFTIIEAIEKTAKNLPNEALYDGREFVFIHAKK